jgi:hypothetical protein
MSHSLTLVGLAYYAPQDVTFSMWFFYIGYFQLTKLIFRTVGLKEPSGFPFYREQSAGAFVAIALVLAWSGRRHLVRIWQAVLNARTATARADENLWADPMSYRFALVGVDCGFLSLCLWYILAGMSWWVAGTFSIPILLFTTVFVRGRAETGVASSPHSHSGRPAIRSGRFSARTGLCLAGAMRT